MPPTRRGPSTGSHEQETSAGSLELSRRLRHSLSSPQLFTPPLGALAAKKCPPRIATVQRSHACRPQVAHRRCIGSTSHDGLMAFAAAVRALVHRNVFVCAGTCRMYMRTYVHRCGRAPSFQRVPARAAERCKTDGILFHGSSQPTRTFLPSSLVRVVPCVGTAQHVNTLPKSCSLPISGLRPRLGRAIR